MNDDDIELHHGFQTVEAFMPTLERQEENTVYVVTPREPTPDRARLATHYLGPLDVLTTIADELAEATWEDAEWR